MMNKFSRVFMGAVLSALSACGSVPIQAEVAPSTPPSLSDDRRADSVIAPFLISLIDEDKLSKLSPEDYQNTALKELLPLTTPAGYGLKFRLLELGIPLAQALAVSRDRQLRQRLLEAARWSNRKHARAEGLLAVARLKNPEDIKYFREALLDTDVAVQFAALEALAIWGLPEAIPYFLNAAEKSWSPLIRVYAAQCAFRLGNSKGREKLVQFLTDKNWVLRAMAARYLGELGPASDADLLLSRIGSERDNRFVLAEACIASLNLLAKKPGNVAPPAKPVSRPARAARPREAYEMEPLVVTAPRLKISPNQILDVRIDNELISLLEKIAVERPDYEEIIDVNLEEINKLVTPTGFGLKIRYSDITFLITEGLAGTGNFVLIRRLENIARTHASPAVRASALVALGFNPNRPDISIFQEAMNPGLPLVVRFGVVEGLSRLDSPFARSLLAGMAQSDTSKVIQMFAAQALQKTGDNYGRQILLPFLDDPDWVVRAMAAYYIGEVGEPEDYNRLEFKLRSETNARAIVEDSLAMLKLSR